MRKCLTLMIVSSFVCLLPWLPSTHQPRALGMCMVLCSSSAFIAMATHWFILKSWIHYGPWIPFNVCILQLLLFNESFRFISWHPFYLCTYSGVDSHLRVKGERPFRLALQREVPIFLSRGMPAGPNLQWENKTFSSQGSINNCFSVFQRQ
jgi:hypothetical protein